MVPSLTFIPPPVNRAQDYTQPYPRPPPAQRRPRQPLIKPYLVRIPRWAGYGWGSTIASSWIKHIRPTAPSTCKETRGAHTDPPHCSEQAYLDRRNMQNNDILGAFYMLCAIILRTFGIQAGLRAFQMPGKRRCFASEAQKHGSSNPGQKAEDGEKAFQTCGQTIA